MKRNIGVPIVLVITLIFMASIVISDGTLSKVGVVSQNLSLIDAYVTPNVQVIGNDVQLYINATDYEFLWADITLPNSSIVKVTLVNDAFTNYTTLLLGQHNITFWAQNLLTNQTQNLTDYFIVVNNSLVFNAFLINNTYTGENSTLDIKYAGSVVKSKQSDVGNFTNITAPDYVYDLLFQKYDNSLYAELKDINISKQNNRTIGFDKITNTSWLDSSFPEVTEPLGLYAVTDQVSDNITNRTGFSLSSMDITLSYATLAYSNEDYLDLYFCNDWNFSERDCAGNFVSIGSNATLYKNTDQIVISLTEYGALIVSQEEEPVIPPGGGGGRGGGGPITAPVVPPEENIDIKITVDAPNSIDYSEILLPFTVTIENTGTIELTGINYAVTIPEPWDFDFSFNIDSLGPGEMFTTELDARNNLCSTNINAETIRSLVGANSKLTAAVTSLEGADDSTDHDIFMNPEDFIVISAPVNSADANMLVCIIYDNINKPAKPQAEIEFQTSYEGSDGIIDYFKFELETDEMFISTKNYPLINLPRDRTFDLSGKLYLAGDLLSPAYIEDTAGSKANLEI